MGINIKDLKPGIFLFQFYHKDDMNWVLSNGPWTFDGALLVMNIVKVGEDPVKVSLNEVDFWIQIHDLPICYMTEMMGKQLGNFFGTFLQYDAKNNSSIWREFMRLRIRVDVRKPLKRKKKIVKKDKTEIVVNCKYEKLVFVLSAVYCHIQNASVERNWRPMMERLPRNGDIGYGLHHGKWLAAVKTNDSGRSVTATVGVGKGWIITVLKIRDFKKLIGHAHQLICVIKGIRGIIRRKIRDIARCTETMYQLRRGIQI